MSHSLEVWVHTSFYVLVAYHVSMECVSLQFCGRIPWIVLSLLTRNHSFLLNPLCSSIERHLANGGNDRPSEILLRYGTETGLLFLFCFEAFRDSPLPVCASHHEK